MKKIVLLVNSLKMGGAEKVVQILANKLCNEFEIYLITIEKQEYFFIDKRVKTYHLSESNGREKHIKKIFSLLFLSFKLKQYLKFHNIDKCIVQSHLFRANYINILARIFGSKHKVQIVNHTLTSRLKKEGLSGRLNIFLIKLLYQHADTSISVSKQVQNELDTFVKLPNSKFIINNPFDKELIEIKSSEKIEDFIYKKDQKYLIIVGRINSIKRIDIVIKALNKINDKNLNLILLGKEEDVSVKDLLKLSKNPKCIHYLGDKNNPYKYIKASNCLILSSNSESFGNVIVESMLCKTPVISSDCGGPREILAPAKSINNQLKKGDNIELCDYGILFPVDDVEKLTIAIKLLLNDKKLYKKYKQKSILRAKDFALEKIIGKYKKVLINE